MTEYFDPEKIIRVVNDAKRILREQIQKIEEFESTHLEVGRSHDRVIYDTNTRVAIGRFE